MDPYMVNKLKAWVWTDGGPYFGIPISNYFAWIMITFLVNLVYRKTNHMLPLIPQGRVSWEICLIPLAAYAINMAGAAVAGYPEPTRLIALFAMGIPLAFAVVRLWFTNTGRG